MTFNSLSYKNYYLLIMMITILLLTGCLANNMNDKNSEVTANTPDPIANTNPLETHFENTENDISYVASNNISTSNAYQGWSVHNGRIIYTEEGGQEW